MNDQRQLQRAIAALSARETGLDAEVLAVTLALLRDELAATEQAPDANEETAERKQIAVLFAQIDGLASLVGASPPEERAALAGGIWAYVDELVEQFGGVVDKHMGDVIMAVFGLPAAREDDVERAVRCALAISDFGAHAEPPTGAGSGALPGVLPSPLPVRVGVNTGPVLVGRLGTDTVSTVIGDTVNVASRLRHAGEAPGVYLSASTWRFVQHRYIAEPLGAVEVRGRSSPVNAYRIEGSRPAGSFASSRSIAGVSVPLVGRDEELRQLLGAVEAVRQNRRPQLMTLLGDAGIGKSRLVSELHDSAMALDFPVLWFTGRSEPRLQQMPYSLLRSISRSGDGQRDSDTRASDPALYRARAGDAVASDRPTLAAAVLDYLLAQRGDSEVLVLTLEDVHWADRESLAEVEQLLTLAGDLPLLVLAVARPVLLERLPEWGDPLQLEDTVLSSRLALRPLGLQDTGALVAQILRLIPDPPQELIEMIVRSAGGNPFYVEELITVLIDDAVIQTAGDAWAVQPVELARLRVPDTLTGVVQARLDRLPESERMILQQAAVIGDEFWEGAVSDVNRAGRFPVADDEIPEALQRLADRELIQPAPVSALPGQQAFVFSHAVLREVTYETVLLRDRQPYHLAAAKWMERQVGARLSEFAAPIAEQFAAARQNAQAATLYEMAAARARQDAQHGRVVQYERQALELLSELPQYIERRMSILGRLAVALQDEGYPTEAREAYETLLLAAEEDGNLLLQTQTHLSLALLARQMADIQGMRDRAESAAQLAALIGAEAEKEQALGLLAAGV